MVRVDSVHKEKLVAVEEHAAKGGKTVFLHVGGEAGEFIRRGLTPSFGFISFGFFSGFLSAA